jgi:gliding motility-associated protein GldE
LDPDPSPLPLLLGLFALVLLLVGSAFASASEVAFFSLEPRTRNAIRESLRPDDQRIQALLEQPEKLLATLLVLNNAFNLALVLLSTWLITTFLPVSLDPWIATLLEIVGITVVILTFGEILPKSYASIRPHNTARSMAVPLGTLFSVFSPLTTPLMATGRWFNDSRKAGSLSVNDLENALDITTSGQEETQENQWLRGIVRFGGVSAKQIMAQRANMVVLQAHLPFPQVLQKVVDHGYSRYPVYGKSLDEIVGILHTKDLLPYLGAAAEFSWKGLIRKALFVPEGMKIDDLLREFQTQKMHLAVVVDEYGGTSGLVTLEDVMEEIVGEIADEFDEEDFAYSRLDEHTVVFEGRTPLNDVVRVLGLSSDALDPWRGEAESLAGLLLQNSTGQLPPKGHECPIGPFLLTAEAVDKRRIVRVKVEIQTDAE